MAMLAYGALLNLSFALSGWPGVTILAAIVGVAFFTRSRLPWIATAIEKLLGLLLYTWVCALAVGWAGSVGILRPWLVAAMVALAGTLFLAWLYLIVKRWRENGHTPATTDTNCSEKD